jgi:DNA-binding MarR family transcriptional regulator
VDRRLLLQLHRASHAAVSHANAILRQQLGISVAQLGTLSLLVERPDCTLSEIAAVLDLNKSAVSGMLTRLERSELIARRPNPQDGRASLLRLLERGRRVRAKSQPIFGGLMAEMTAGFTPAEIEVVLRFLNTLIERFGTGAGSGESDD